MEPDVEVPFPSKYGAPYCPNCGYRCGCCCMCKCQTPCTDPNVDAEMYEEDWCECMPRCHGGHEPWECGEWSVRYVWAKEKSERLAKENNE